MVAAGASGLFPATKIAAFWAFLLGVCLIAAGLTFLETVANPYSTVLGAQDFAATRINLAQSCNGIGWIFGPLAGAMFFYSTTPAVSTQERKPCGFPTPRSASSSRSSPWYSSGPDARPHASG